MLFQEAVSDYFKAMRQKDMGIFRDLIADEDWVALILPNGQYITGKAEILSFHEDFFADEDWSMEVSILQQREVGDTGLVLADILYRDVDETGSPYEMRYYLHLLFYCRNGKWQVCHDQNTMNRQPM